MDEKIVGMSPDYARRLNATMREICSKPQGKDSTRRESLFYLVRKATLTADIANGQAAAKLDDAAETEITVHSDLDLKRNDDVWVIWRGRWDAAT
ncbi:MAG: hypothetical protein IIZ25_08050 [Thermoguttaceae bacterium]|nr:hypothetical protein [Thermoguttaceae bacterium]